MMLPVSVVPGRGAEKHHVGYDGNEPEPCLSTSRHKLRLPREQEAQGAVRLQVGEIGIVDMGTLQKAAGLDQEEGG